MINRGRRGHRLVALATILGGTLVATSAFAIDPFEIQVYDGTANAPGAFGLELHVNNVTAGARVPPATLEYPQAHETHFTLEPSLGLFKWWELGLYFQAAARGDSAFDYGGFKLRNKFVTPEGWDPHFRLGINVEFSVLPQGYDQARWGSELRPIAAWENDLFLFAINPIIDTPLGGPDYSKGPEFGPCAEVLLKIHDSVALGFEYYSNFGPFSSFLPWREQEQYIYEVTNVLSIKHFELNLGVGEGLTDGSNRFVMKTILGYTWGEPDEEPKKPAHSAFLARPLRGLSVR